MGCNSSKTTSTAERTTPSAPAGGSEKGTGQVEEDGGGAGAVPAASEVEQGAD